MRRATFLLLFLSASWASSLGQSAPKFTTPRIVATFERLGLTHELPPTTLYTPKTWGTFRISMVMVGTVANGASDSEWSTILQFADADNDNAPCDLCGTHLPVDVPRNASTEFPIRARPGQPITFSVVSFGDTSHTKYNVWVVVEQLM